MGSEVTYILKMVTSLSMKERKLLQGDLTVTAWVLLETCSDAALVPLPSSVSAALQTIRLLKREFPAA